MVAVGLFLAVFSGLSGCATTGKGKMDLGGKALTVGDQAPELAIGKWVQGQPVEKFVPGKVYLIEFWSTLCGPCIASMPHLAEIQKTYGNKIHVIGVTTDSERDVLRFLQSPYREGFPQTAAQVADYTIAVDQIGTTNSRFMRAAQQRTIPTAFLVGKDGKIKYIGHPNKMGAALRDAMN